MHALEFEGVSKSFAENDVIRDISFSVEQGEIFGLLGPNGAGKTTTIRCMLNILIPNSGFIKIDNDIVSRDTSFLKEDIGYLPGELYYPKGFSVKNLPSRELI